MTKTKTLLKAGVFAALLGAPFALSGTASAQEAPAPPADTQPLAVLPCTLTAWLENGIRDSADVVCLQTVLRTKGIDTGPIDGWFGPVTERAVTAFQIAAAITADGEVGQETATALGADMVISYSGAATDPTPDRVVIVERSSSSSSATTTTRSSSSSSSSSTSSSSSSGGGSTSSGSSGGGWTVDWDAIARCESGGNWGHGPVTNSTGTYSGGLMWNQRYWIANGGQQYAEWAYQATKEQQIAISEAMIGGSVARADQAWDCL